MLLSDKKIGLMWYGTPCNNHKDERIIKSDYTHGFKHFKDLTISPKMHYKIRQNTWKVKPVQG